MDLRGWDVRIVAMGAAVAVLAGCGGDPEPVVTPTPTPTETVTESPSPTPSPSPTELTEEEILAAIPDALLSESFVAAIYFSQFFLELYPAMLTPEHDATLFTALSSPECGFCESSIATVEAQKDASAYSEGGGFVWAEDESPFRGGIQEDGYWYVEQPFDVARTSTYSASGDLLGEDDGGSGIVTTKLEFDGVLWSVAGVNFEYDND